MNNIYLEKISDGIIWTLRAGVLALIFQGAKTNAFKSKKGFKDYFWGLVLAAIVSLLLGFSLGESHTLDENEPMLGIGATDIEFEATIEQKIGHSLFYFAAFSLTILYGIYKGHNTISQTKGHN